MTEPKERKVSGGLVRAIASLIVALLKKNQGESENAKAAAARENKLQATWQRCTAIATIVIAFAAAGFSWYQGWVARDAERRQLRAYIGVVPPADNQVANAFIPPSIPLIRLTPHNFGLTPAYNAAYEGGIDMGSYPLPKTFEYSVTTVDTPPNPVTIYPGPFELAGIVISTKRPLTNEEIASIQDGKSKRLYAYGTLKYDDAFGKPHFTNFCVGFYNLTATQVKREPCNDHNDSN